MTRLTIATAAAIVLLATGCAELQEARNVTLNDALQYVNENHAIRVAYRAEKEQILSEQRMAYRTAATVAASSGDLDAANELWDKALTLLAKHYRELATIESIKAGITAYGEFKKATEPDQ